MNSTYTSLHRPRPLSAAHPCSPQLLLRHRGSRHASVRPRLQPIPSPLRAQAAPINLATLQLPSWPILRTLMDHVHAADLTWLNYVTDNPLLAVLLSLLLLRLVPWVVNTFISRIAVPVLFLLLAWGAVTHPSQLMDAIAAVSDYVTAQPETASKLVLLLALVALAPYLLLAAGALVAADVLITLVAR